MLSIIFLVLVAYLLGSIPSGVWIGQIFYHKDVRKFGSGNMGTTNTFRVLGKKAGICVLILDIAKGSLAALIPLLVLHNAALSFVIGMVAVIGHIFPIFANFRGGKAVATSVGVLLVYNPLFFGIAWAIFLVTLLLTSMVSVASMLGFSLVCIVSFFFHDVILSIVAVIMTIAVFYLHHQNIARILAGSENMVPFGLGYYLRQKNHDK